MSLVERAARRFEQVITPDKVDWEKYLKPSDVARIVPAENLAETGRERLLLGRVADYDGLEFPWPKTIGHVLIKPGKLVVWTGWSHHGKTALLKMLQLYAIKQGEKPLICSMEEDVAEVWHDMAILACATDEPTARAVDNFIEFIRGKLWFYDQQGTIDAARAIALIRYAAKERGVTQLVFDSLMCLDVSRDDYDAQRRFVAELKAAAKDTGVTVHLVAHMRKRDGKTGEEELGTMHDIAGGHEIASIADYVFQVWRNKKKDEKKPAAIVEVHKQRGRVNWLGRIGLDFHDKSRQFTEGKMPMSFWGE